MLLKNCNKWENKKDTTKTTKKVILKPKEIRNNNYVKNFRLINLIYKFSKVTHMMCSPKSSRFFI